MARKYAKVKEEPIASETNEVTTETPKKEVKTVKEPKVVKKVEEPKEETIQPQPESVVEEPVVQPVQPKDKFEASKKVDADASYEDVIKTLRDQKLTNEQKLDHIYKTSNVTYKALIDAFYAFDGKVYGNQDLRSSSELYNAERNKLWSFLKKALDTKDAYVRNAKIAILVLIYDKLKARTFNYAYFALHGDSFADPEGFQEMNFIMATLGAISMFLADRKYKVRKNINFKHPEFKYGSQFEEFYSSIEMR